MDPYQQHIIDRHKQPLHQGSLDQPTHQLQLDNTLCGDSIQLDIVLDHNTITDIKWQGQGCAISTTATDILIDHMQGLDLTKIRGLSDDQFLQILGLELRPSRLKCALLGLNCLRQLQIVTGDEHVE